MKKMIFPHSTPCPNARSLARARIFKREYMRRTNLKSPKNNMRRKLIVWDRIERKVEEKEYENNRRKWKASHEICVLSIFLWSKFNRLYLNSRDAMIHRHPMQYPLRCYDTKCMYVCCGRHKYGQTLNALRSLSLWPPYSLRSPTTMMTTTAMRAPDLIVRMKRQELYNCRWTQSHSATIWRTHTHARTGNVYEKRIQRGERAPHSCTPPQLRRPKGFVNVSENDSSANVLIGLNHEQIVCLHFRCAGNETNGISCVSVVVCEMIRPFGRWQCVEVSESQ